MIETALNFLYSYLKTRYTTDKVVKMCKAICIIANRPTFDFISVEDSKISTYDEVQSFFSKLNEKESIRKQKGVYYTPKDLVDFILLNCVKSLYGDLNPENISSLHLDNIPYESFSAQKKIYDPTCGTGEFLLAALNLKFSIWKKHCSLSSRSVVKIISTIKGNDINPDSIIITRLRLFLSLLQWCDEVDYDSVTEELMKNFTTFDFVSYKESQDEKFDIVIGNPPYVEDSKSGLSLDVRYGNIFANVLKNASDRLNLDGSMGFVIPLSYISTPRMKKIRNDLFCAVPEQYILSYADRPDCLFPSVHQKLCVLIGKKRKGEKEIYTSNYHYWYKKERHQLFTKAEVIKNIFFKDEFIPKLGNKHDCQIFAKIIQSNTNVSVYEESRNGVESVYLNRRETFWMKAYRTFVDDPEYKMFHYHTAEEADYCYCLINSSLFWWYWICVSDCWHVSKNLNGFKAPKISDYTKLTKMAAALREKLELTKVYVGTKQTQYEYKHKDCLAEIHMIDDFINSLFELSEEESKYIKEFALIYRTSGGVN